MAKKALIGLMVIALSSLTGLLLIEGALYVVGLDFARVWEPDPQLGWHHVPGARRMWTEEGRGFIQINSLGQSGIKSAPSQSRPTRSASPCTATQ